MRTHFPLILALAVFSIGSLAHGYPVYPTPTTTLEALQLESSLRWKRESSFRFGYGLLNAGVGGFAAAMGGVRLNNSSSDSSYGRYQSYAGALLLTASAAAISAPILYFSGGDTVATYRWHQGLTSSAAVLAGTGLMLGAVAESRTDSAAELVGLGMGLVLYGLPNLSDAIWDWVGKWHFMGLRDRLEQAHGLSDPDKQALVADGLEALESMKRLKALVLRCVGGTLMLTGGGVVAYELAEGSESMNILAVSLGAGVLGIGGWVFALGFIDRDLFPMLKSRNVEFTLALAPYTDDTVLALRGSF